MNAEELNSKILDTLSKNDELYTSEFLDELNNYSDCIVERNDYVNEFFLYFVVPQLEKTRDLKLKNNGSVLPPVNFWDYTRSFAILVCVFFTHLIYLVALPFFVLVKFKQESLTSCLNQPFAVIRSQATFSKMSFLKERGVFFYNDSLVYGSADNELSLYSQSLSVRLRGILVIPLLGTKDFSALFLMAWRYVGVIAAVDVLSYYRKRLVHKVTFEFYLSSLLKTAKPEILYTGNKEDRFALIEKRLAHDLRIKTVCIPHGLEYSFKMPAGLVGEIFFCNSLASQKYLKNLYGIGETNFVFDESIVSQMLSRHLESTNLKKVVFFPESREPQKNLVIIEFLKKAGIQFFVKLHGKDSLENYNGVIDESFLICDFDLAISNSICLARKSTVLLEAVYNHSIPIAVLVDSKDSAYFEFMFPSLKDESIFKVYTFAELKILVEKLKEQNV